MVIGHTGSVATKFIYMFHMPLFFFLSGYLFKKTDTPLMTLKKRVKSLYMPFVEYELAYLLLHNIFANLHLTKNTYTAIDIFHNILKILTFNGIEDFLGSFWFLASLFVVTILFSFINNYIAHNIKENIIANQIITAIAFFCLGNILTFEHINIPNSTYNSEFINVAFTAYPVYYLGYLYREHESKIKFNIYYAAGAFMILLLNYPFGDTVEMYKNNYPSPAYFIVGALCGIYLTLYLSVRLRKRDNKIMRYIGQNTIPILGLHILCFRILDYVTNIYGIKNMMVSQFGWILYAIVGIFIPLGVKYLYDKVVHVIRKLKIPGRKIVLFHKEV